MIYRAFDSLIFLKAGIAAGWCKQIFLLCRSLKFRAISSIVFLVHLGGDFHWVWSNYSQPSSVLRWICYDKLHPIAWNLLFILSIDSLSEHFKNVTKKKSQICPYRIILNLWISGTYQFCYLWSLIRKGQSYSMVLAYIADI